MYYVYILKSRKDSKHYIGSTENLDKRVANHNAGKVSSTRDRRPFELIHFEKFGTRILAEKRERYLKTGDGRVVLKNILKLPATEPSAG